MPPRKPGLTPKEDRFCVEYVKDHNGTQAAIRAGFSKRSAKEIAHRLLTKAHVKARVAELDTKVEEKALITVQEVIEGLKRIANFDPRALYDKKGKLLKPHKWPKEAALACGPRGTLFASDRKSAWDSLGKYLKMWKDSADVNVNVLLEDIVAKSQGETKK